MILTIRDRACLRCKKDTHQEISCKILASGAEAYGWWCLECKFWTPSKSGGFWIAKETLVSSGVDLSLVPVVEISKGERCAKCGHRGTELHHWSPRAIFGDECENWPKDYLCKRCHDEWHLKVTPQLVKEGF